jgi:hypothetical protein
MSFKYIMILIIAILGALNYSNNPVAATREPLQQLFLLGQEDNGQVIRRDYSSGIESIIDTIQFFFARGVIWQLEDRVHGRIFFIEGPQPYPFRTHYYDFATKQVLDLPYDNYGDGSLLFITPQSRYIIITYYSVDDTSWSEENIKTAILDGATLGQIREQRRLLTSNQSQGALSFITRNDNFLINPDYINTSDTTKEQAYVIYTLPELNPIDTFFFARYQWRGSKRVKDISDNGILFVATKTDTTRGLTPGNYAFVVGWPNRRLQTRFVPLAPGNNFDAKLSPDGNEIDVLYPSEGKLRRYPVARGRILGEIDVPQGSGFNFYGTDGNLYLNSPDGNIVVDYQHNQIIRIFQFESR